MFELSENILLKILKYGVYASLVWFFLITSASLYPAHAGKVLFLQGLIEVLFFFYIFLIVKYPQYRPKFNMLTISLIVWAVAMLLSAIFGMDFYVSFFSSFGRMTGVFFIFHILSFYFILTAVFRNQNDWKQFLTANIFAGLILSFFAIYQKVDSGFLSWLGYTDRAVGLLGNPSFLATYIIFMIFITLFIFLKYGENIKIRIFSVISFLVFVATLLLTATRGSMIGFLAGLLVFLLIYAILIKNRKVKVLFSLFFIFLIISSLFLWMNRDKEWMNSIPVLKRAVSISWSDYTLGSRKIFWKGAIEGFKEKPIFGWGPENYNLIIDKYYNVELSNYVLGESWVTKPHNVFLEHLANGGIVGFLSFLFVFIAAAILLMRLYRKDYNNISLLTVFLSCLVAHLVQNIVFFDTYYTYYMLGIILAFISVSYGFDIDIFLQKQIELKTSNGILLVVMILCIFLVFMNISTYRSSVAANGGDVKFLRKASFYKDDSLGEYLKNYLKGTIKLENKEDNLKLISILNSELDKMIANHPGDSSKMTMKAAFLNNAGRYDKKYLDDSERLIKGTIDMYPGRYQLYQLLGELHILRKDYDNAAENYGKIIGLNPKLGVGHWYLGATLYSRGDREEGLKELDIAYNIGYRPTNAFEWGFWAQTYTESKKYWEAIYLYQEAIKLDPQNSKYYEKLAAIYGEVGDKDNAIKMANKVLEIDPGSKDDVEKFISSFK